MIKSSMWKNEPAVDVEAAKPALGEQATRPHRPGGGSSLTLNMIRALAYRKWEAAGSPPGDCTRFWQEAEQELLTRE